MPRSRSHSRRSSPRSASPLGSICSWRSRRPPADADRPRGRRVQLRRDGDPCAGGGDVPRDRAGLHGLSHESALRRGHPRAGSRHRSCRHAPDLRRTPRDDRASDPALARREPGVPPRARPGPGRVGPRDVPLLATSSPRPWPRCCRGGAGRAERTLFVLIPIAFLAGLLRVRLHRAREADLEVERLQAQLRAQLVEVRASRARIVEAGDAERRRLDVTCTTAPGSVYWAFAWACGRPGMRLADGWTDSKDKLLAEADAEVMDALSSCATSHTGSARHAHRRLRTCAGGPRPADAGSRGGRGFGPAPAAGRGDRLLRRGGVARQYRQALQTRRPPGSRS